MNRNYWRFYYSDGTSFVTTYTYTEEEAERYAKVGGWLFKEKVEES